MEYNRYNQSNQGNKSKTHVISNKEKYKYFNNEAPSQQEKGKEAVQKTYIQNPKNKITQIKKENPQKKKYAYDYSNKQIEPNTKIGSNIEKNKRANDKISESGNKNTSGSVATNNEKINDSGKKYNTEIKSNINKINIKEQQNEEYKPYSTILKIESGIDLSHDKLGQK